MSAEQKTQGPAGAPGMPGRPGGPMGRGHMGGGAMMGRPVEKAKDFKRTLKRLLGYLAPERYRFIAVFFLAIASTVFSILGPKIMGRATTKLGDGILAKYMHIIEIQFAIMRKMPPAVIQEVQQQPVPKIDFTYIGHILLLMVGLYILSALFSFIMSYIMAGVSQRTVFNMRNDVKVKLDRLPLKYFDARTHGRYLEPCDQRHGQHCHNPSAEPGAVDYLSGDRGRCIGHDADHQSRNDVNCRCNSACVCCDYFLHRKKVTEVFCGPAKVPGPVERSCRGNVHRS